MRDLTQSRLKEILDYDESTGIFTRRVIVHGSNAPEGSIVGVNVGRYLKVSIDCGQYFLHRLAWLYMHGEWPIVIDHINGDGFDNRISNLRNTTQAGNTQNVRSPRGTSKYVGVSYKKDRGKWRAKTKVGYVDHHIGYFDTEEQARDAYLKAKAVLHPYWANEVDMAGGMP